MTAVEASNLPSPVLVTGASGFIGQTVCEVLLVAGVRVRALVRHSPIADDLARHAGIETIQGDLQDAGSLKAACSGVAAIVHSAGLAHVANVSEAETQAVNLEGTENLLAAARAGSVQRLVFVSSILAGLPATERGQNPYAQAKFLAEQAVAADLARGRPDYVILRPANVYGPGMGGNMVNLMRAIRSGWLPRLPDFDSRLAMISRRDLARVIAISLASDIMSRQTYDVTDGEMYQLGELERAIYHNSGRRYPGWQMPRVLLYGAATTAEILNKLTGLRIGLNRQSLRRLEETNEFANEKLQRDIGFVASDNFYTALSGIMAALEPETRRGAGH